MTLHDYYIAQALPYIPYKVSTTKEVQDYYRRNYTLYFHTKWWRDLNDLLIDSDSDASCAICERWDTILAHDEYLVIHHVSYENLFCEKLKRDIYIVCSKCHQSIHFYMLGLRKTTMSKRFLLKRMRFLKSIYCIRRLRFATATWYMFRCIVS